MRRRFTAFIILAMTVFFALIGSFTYAFTGIHSGLEFANGTQYVYSVTSSDENETPVDIDAAAEEMARRLKNADVSYYDIETEGSEQIRVTFTGASASEATHLRTLLAYNASFTLCTTDDEVCGTSEEIFQGSVARIEYVNQYPIVIIPISDSSKVEIMRQHAQELTSESTDEESDENSVDYTMLVLWANKQEGDDFASAMDPNNENHERIQEKVLMTFSSAEEGLYYNGNRNAISRTVQIEQDSEGNVSTTAVRQAAIDAQHAINFFNAGALDYDVDFLFSTAAPAAIEPLVIMGDRLAINWNSKLLIGAIVAFALVLIILALYYKLGSLVAGLSGGATLLVTLLFFNLFGVEFSIGAVIGMIVTGGLALFSNVFLFEKLKDELYRGRTLKKANIEAGKRSLLPIVDTSVIVLLASLITFFVGEPLIKPFAVMVTIGAVANLLFSWLGTKLMMWILCNDNWLQDKKHLFGVQAKFVPNTALEEKQTYFGPYTGINFTKRSTRIGIISGIAAVIGVVCCVIFHYTIGTFNYGNAYDGQTRIQLVVQEDSAISNVESFAKDLEDEGFAYSDLTFAEGTDLEDDDITLHYYVVTISSLPEDDAAIYDNPVENEDGSIDRLATIQTYLEQKYQALDSEAILQVLAVVPATHQLNVGYVALALMSGLLLSSIYVCIRYGFGKALGAVVITALTSFLTIALFIVARLTFTDLAALGLLAVMNFSLMGSMFLFTREKEMRAEDKENDRQATMVKAVASAMAPMSILTLGSVFVAITLLAIGPISYEFVFLMIILGCALTLLMNTTLLGPTFLLFQKIFGRINLPKKPRKRKKKVEAKPKSSEPEEAIFIGIND